MVYLIFKTRFQMDRAWSLPSVICVNSSNRRELIKLVLQEVEAQEVLGLVLDRDQHQLVDKELGDRCQLSQETKLVIWQDTTLK